MESNRAEAYTPKKQIRLLSRAMLELTDEGLDEFFSHRRDVQEIMREGLDRMGGTEFYSGFSAGDWNGLDDNSFLRACEVFRVQARQGEDGRIVLEWPSRLEYWLTPQGLLEELAKPERQSTLLRSHGK